jgi:natural product biosynthesis luciferase-like monooxygenase protein
MSNFSCVVVGNESLLIGCSEFLLDRGNTISAVVTNDAAIRAWATTRGLKVVGKATDLTTAAPFDWLLSIANLSIIPEAVLTLPTKGAINFHDGPLPRYAGLNAPAWAILNRETKYGVTWHMLAGGVDEGDIVEQALFDIAADDTAFSLNSKCYAAAMDSFARVTTQLESGAPKCQPQDLSARSYFARDDRPSASGHIDFDASAEDIAARVRAMDFGEYWNPLTCPKIDVNGRVLLVGNATITAPATDAAPGTVLEVHSDGLTLATGTVPITLNALRDCQGQPVDLGKTVATGQVLTVPPSDRIDTLNAMMPHPARADAHWRPKLRAIHPVPVPFSSRSDAAPIWVQTETLSATGLTEPQVTAAVAAWALLSSGEDHADIAVTNPDIARVADVFPQYAAGWVPVQIANDTTTPFAELVEHMSKQLDDIAKIGTHARDLVARDHEITGYTTPQIGVTLGTSPISGTALTVSIAADGSASLHYDTTRLTQSDLAILSARLRQILDHVASGAADAEPIASLPVLPDAERDMLVTQWNQTAKDYDPSLTVHAAFEAQAARTPDATAIVYEDTMLSYAQLDARANQAAQVLRQMGVRPGSHVGLCLHRSVDLLIGALAILKAGGAYVPLDPAYPADRLTHYVTDSAASVIVTQDSLLSALPVSNAQVLVLDKDTRVDAADTGVLDGRAEPGDLAYLIYTSGSTGTPKGVMVEHRNVVNFFAGMDDRIDHQDGSVWLAVTSLAFDISVLELFYTLARGYKIVLSNDAKEALSSRKPIAISDRHINFNLFYWGNDGGVGPKKYELLLEGAKFADANGFNAVWTPERHFHAFGGPYPNPSVTGAAVAAVTKNLSVRAGSCVAPLHHPARIAEEWSVIDNLTNGRAGIGIASGWQPDDFVLRPENTPPANKPAMYDAIAKLRALWRGETVEFPTQTGEMFGVVTQPRPVSKELPIWVTIAGNPDTWREAGEIGANVLTHLLGQTIDEVADKIKIYHAALRGAGHNPDDFKVTVMLHTFIAEDRETAARIAREPMKDYLRSAAGLIKQYAWAFPAFKKPKGVTNPFEVDLGTLGDEELEAILDFAFERYFEDAGLFGTVEDGLARAEQLKRIGVDEIACLIDYGIPTALVMAGLTPLAEVLKAANTATELDDDDYSIAAQMIRHRVSHLQCTPSMARMIAMNEDARLAMGHLKHLMLGGEALSADLVTDLRSCTDAQITNMYGPTETTIWSTTQTVGPQSSGTVPIGAAIANTSLFVRDAQGQLAPMGVPGELFIGGDGVTRGYWQRPDMTADRFVPNGFGAGRLYRTGDLVRRMPDGTLDFLGRTDHQVKIRGQRIELGEIESCLANIDTVRQAVVVPREMAPGDIRLVAYLTTTAPVSASAVRAHAQAALTEAMVPQHVVLLDEFPLTPNKKIDRKALPVPVRTRSEAPAETTAPASNVERDIATIWSRVLGVNDVRSDDNFFSLGGHSLLAVQAHRDIKAELKLDSLSITDIFRFPTLSGLAAHIGARDSSGTQDEPVVAQDRTETMSKRRAMRAGRGMRAG